MFSANFGQPGPILTHLGSGSAQHDGQLLRELGQFVARHSLAAFGQVTPNWGRIGELRAISGPNWPNYGRFGRVWRDFGQHRPNSTSFWPRLGQLWQTREEMLADDGTMLAEFAHIRSDRAQLGR